MYRTWVITRHTFFEAIAQPIFSLLISISAVVVLIFAVLPFFTLGEDTVMYKSVGLDVITLLVLLGTLFATSKSIHEEIEDRTMLTLMSKPVARAEVLIGKYIGLIAAAGMAVLVLGVLLCFCTYYRVPTDYQIAAVSISTRESGRLHDLRMMHLNGLIPSLLLVWMMISVLAAISVAISTRFSLVVNLPAVILIYLAGNLSRFLPDALGYGILGTTTNWTIGTLLPFLEVFDLRRYAIYGQIGLDSNTAESVTKATSLSFVWENTALAAVYAVAYATAALAAGMLVFRTRELGGAEG